MKKLLIFALLLIPALVGFAEPIPDGYAPVSTYQTLECKIPEGCIYGDDGILYAPKIVHRVNMPEVQANNISNEPITADTPAVEPSTTAEILRIVLIAIGSMLGFVLNKLLPLLNSLLKAHMHFRGSSVVADALTQAIADMGAEVQKALADGVIAPEEKAELKRRAKEIAKERLKNLSGFYKRDLMGWLDEALEVQLAKLLSRI